MNIDPRHPRFWSLAIRERLATAVRDGVAVPQGLIAHGRGEAFDYLLGERTTPSASRATVAAAALLLSARAPVLSVNGNTAALVGKEMVKLASVLPAAHIEVNLFHRNLKRELAIAHLLKRLGARDILGIGSSAQSSITGVASARKHVDPRGIASSDVVLVPLEDGDRAEALERAGKRVIAIDLNPLSRTSRVASISIVDNVVRAVPGLIHSVVKMRKFAPSKLHQIVSSFDNRSNLDAAIQEAIRYLRGWAKN